MIRHTEEIIMYYNNSQFALVVKQSQIPNSGNGVYTLQHIPKDTVIAEYLGKIVPCSERIKDPDYTVYVNRKISIDAQYYPRCYMAMINDTFGTDFAVNCKFKKCGKRVHVIASSDIAPGEELFLSYGSAYWQSRK